VTARFDLGAVRRCSFNHAKALGLYVVVVDKPQRGRIDAAAQAAAGARAVGSGVAKVAVAMG
jgi:hypothetical protein